ncbi:MAG: TolC family protein, partial [Zetaproteobacteria bacterium]
MFGANHDAGGVFMHVAKPVRHGLGLILMLLPSWASATVLSLERAEAMALADNPALAAAGQQAAALAAVPSQVGSLPDPVLSLKAMNLPADSFSTTQENMTQLQLGVMQAIPFPGKLGLKQQVAEHMA